MGQTDDAAEMYSSSLEHLKQSTRREISSRSSKGRDKEVEERGENLAVERSEETKKKQKGRKRKGQQQNDKTQEEINARRCKKLLEEGQYN